jgi:apolipoprotein N-acyltransferase
VQIARMRALESRRYLLRAANDGVSAVIGPDGRLLAEAPEFEPAVLKARFAPRSGDTPYLVLGDSLVLGVAGLLLAGRALRGYVRVKRSS